MPLAGRIEILPESSTAARHRPRSRIDGDIAHQTKVHHEAAVANAEARDSVTAAPHRHRQARLPRELDGNDDVGDIERPRHHLRTAVDHPVERSPRHVITDILPRDDGAPVSAPKLND